jgi:hypothetical protein
MLEIQSEKNQFYLQRTASRKDTFKVSALQAAVLEKFSVTLAAGLYPHKKGTIKEPKYWRWNNHTRVNCN